MKRLWYLQCISKGDTPVLHWTTDIYCSVSNIGSKPNMSWILDQNWIAFNTLRLRQNGHHFADDIFKWIFLNEDVWIPIKISLKFVPQGPVNNITALVQIMAWRRSVDKPLSGPMVVRLPMHICVTRPQWVKNTFMLIFKTTIHTMDKSIHSNHLFL